MHRTDDSGSSFFACFVVTITKDLHWLENANFTLWCCRLCSTSYNLSWSNIVVLRCFVADTVSIMYVLLCVFWMYSKCAFAFYISFSLKSHTRTETIEVLYSFHEEFQYFFFFQQNINFSLCCCRIFVILIFARLTFIKVVSSNWSPSALLGHCVSHENKISLW